VAERFQHSGDTISKCFHHVLDALTHPEVYKLYIKFPDVTTDCLPDNIRENKKFYLFFKDALGAIDGSHIPVSPPAVDRPHYRNRKGQVSQNLLAACTFDLFFCYVLAGWEGSASDGAIYADAWNRDFIVLDSKYFLGDAGFPICRELLVPYRGVRYHLREWEKAGKQPANHKEVYNLRHSQCRNAVERIFGIAK
ncbi:hypothetical protein M422DRAFT_133398, partial [Sphaerobolus stellatus SS14]